MIHPSFHGTRISSVLGVVTLLVPWTVFGAPSIRAAEEVVVVQGTQTDREMAGDDTGDLGLQAFTVLSQIVSGLPSHVQEEIYEAIEDREDPPAPLTPNYTIRFTPTSMRMDQGSYTWLIVISDVHVGYFGWDSESRQGISQAGTIQGLVNAAEQLAPFETIMESYPERCEPGGEPVELGPFSARRCTYEHTGAVVAGATGLGTDVKTVGNAWIATGIPGEETIQAFYRNLGEKVSSSSGVGDFFAGLIASQLDVMEEGIPVINNTTITMKVQGMSLKKAISNTRVSSVTIETLEDPSEMTEDAIPEDVTMMDMSDLAGSAGGGGLTAGTGATGDAASDSGDPSSDGEQAKQGCDCSCEAFSKMQNMSKKERKAMEKSPEAMAMAMCMGKCMSKWMACAQP